MAAHLPAISLGDLLIAHTGVDLEFRIAVRQRLAGSAAACRLLPRPHRRFHVRKFESRHAEPLGDPRQECSRAGGEMPLPANAARNCSSMKARSRS